MVMLDHVHIRWLIRRDLDDVLDIEWRCLEEWGWNENQFRATLLLKNCIGQVVEDQDGEILGYIIVLLEGTEIFIDKICVDPDYWRMGIGTRMIQKIKDGMQGRKKKRIVMMVSEYETKVCLFLKSCGFRAKKIEKNWFEDGIDGYRMIWEKGK